MSVRLVCLVCLVCVVSLVRIVRLVRLAHLICLVCLVRLVRLLLSSLVRLLLQNKGQENLSLLIQLIPKLDFQKFPQILGEFFVFFIFRGFIP